MTDLDRKLSRFVAVAIMIRTSYLIIDFFKDATLLSKEQDIYTIWIWIALTIKMIRMDACVKLANATPFVQYFFCMLTAIVYIFGSYLIHDKIDIAFYTSFSNLSLFGIIYKTIRIMLRVLQMIAAMKLFRATRLGMDPKEGAVLAGVWIKVTTWLTFSSIIILTVEFSLILAVIYHGLVVNNGQEFVKCLLQEIAIQILYGYGICVVRNLKGRMENDTHK